MNNWFMLSDLGSTAEAVLVFSFVVLVPGYVLAWFLDLMAFRRRMLLTRFTLAVPISIGVCPIVSYLLWRFVPPAVWLFYGACAIAFLLLMIRERRELLSRAALRTAFRRDFVFLALVAGWVVLGALALVDLQIGHRLYFPTVAYDYSLRISVTSSIVRAGVPAQNPFFFPGRTYAMHYHYFWLILCGVAERIGASTLSARHAVTAGTIWCGIGLLALVALYQRFFQSPGQAGRRRRILWAVALLGITGLDILPVIFIELQSKGYYADMEWWNEQITAWIGAVLWTPHHPAGLIACLTGFLLIWDAGRLPGARNRIVSAIVAGLMFSSAVGLTIHVTFVFAIFLVIWMLAEFFRNHRSQAGSICLAGLTAIVVSVPFLAELFAPGASGAVGAIGTTGTFPLRLAVRSFRFFDLALGLDVSGWKTNLANLMILPVNYLLELGFLLIVGVIQCRRMWRDRRNLTEDALCGLTLAATSMVVCTFVSSAVLASNDLGWRGFLPAQFILLIWGADLLAGGLLSRDGPAATTGHKRVLIAATLALGAAGSFYSLFKVRFYPLLSDVTSTPLYSWLSPDRNLGARTYAFRQMYDELRCKTPAAAIFQHNPNAAFEDLFHGIYADRQVAAEGMNCGAYYGGDARLCESRIGIISDLFEKPEAFNANQIDGICERLSIDVLVVKDTDKVWRDRESWVWKRAPMLANSYGRAFACGPRAASGTQAKGLLHKDSRAFTPLVE